MKIFTLVCLKCPAGWEGNEVQIPPCPVCGKPGKTLETRTAVPVTQ